jgi:hypothetical protein
MHMSFLEDYAIEVSKWTEKEMVGKLNKLAKKHAHRNYVQLYLEANNNAICRHLRFNILFLFCLFLFYPCLLRVIIEIFVSIQFQNRNNIVIFYKY